VEERQPDPGRLNPHGGIDTTLLFFPGRQAQWFLLGKRELHRACFDSNSVLLGCPPPTLTVKSPGSNLRYQK
jgi:hypothetical protein